MFNLTSIILSDHASHTESDKMLMLLSGLSESWKSWLSSGSHLVFLDGHV